MSRAVRKSGNLGFSYLHLEGGLFVPDHLAKAVAGDLEFQKADDYEILPGLKLSEEISRFFQIAQGRWAIFDARRKRDDHDALRATQEFVCELLEHAFQFGSVQKVAPVAEGDRAFPVGYMTRGRVAVVIAPHNQELDEPDARFAVVGTGTRRKSPFQLAQEFLNASEPHLWALVTNGRQLRLLRDSAALTRPVWLEVDLEQILTARDWAAFTSCWRLFHGSRAGKAEAAPEECIWERWRKMGQETGLRVRDSLRQGVQEALLALGTGFLQATENESLRQAIFKNELSEKVFFDELLHLVYRFLFIFAVEERELLHPEGTSESAKKLYLEGYSQKRLRERCLRPGASNTHHDLWEGQRIVWKALESGQPFLGLPALGGLFAASQCPHLDPSCLSNAALMTALRALRWSGKSGAFASVDYRNMGPEELGSVYESLLELVPRVDLEIRSFGFVGIGDTEGSTKGNARKTSGSYYTPDSLVQELLKTSLDPVISDRLAKNSQDPIGALLGLRIIDTSCGSGHFLLAAARRVAEKLAQVRSSDGSVRPADYRHALRDVISHCIFGVDRNPMAVELARTALWLESFEAERPLSFLDHHLVCGDALLGLMDINVLEKPIPDKAFVALSGDDRNVCKELSKQNKDAVKLLLKQKESTIFGMDLGTGDPLAALRAVENLSDDTPLEVAQKEVAYKTAKKIAHESALAQLADAWVGAFLLPKVGNNQESIPTTRTLIDARTLGGMRRETKMALDAAQTACEKARVLHWPLAFPTVMSNGGFDVVLGNPPWERIKLQEEEFFATRHALVAEAKNKAERAKRIEWLSEGSLQRNLSPGVVLPEGIGDAEKSLFTEFLETRRTAEAASIYFHVDGADGGRYPLTGVGDVNTYALFAETIRQVLSQDGRAGFIVPTGIATDDSTKMFLQDLVRTRSLSSFFGFKNERFLFPRPVEHTVTFGLMSLLGSGLRADYMEFCWLAYTVQEMQDPARRVRLTPDEMHDVNPNTLTCPVFRTAKDAELTKKIYRNVPVLWREARDGTPAEILWGIRFSTMFHMSGDSHLFQDAPTEDRVPLYEAKMIHQFDHRWATYSGSQAKNRASVKDFDDEDSSLCRNVTPQEKSDVTFSVTPRYWVQKSEVESRAISEHHALLPLFFAQMAQLRAQFAYWFRCWLWGHELLVNPNAFESPLRKEMDDTRMTSQSGFQIVSNGLLERARALRMAKQFPLLQSEQLLLRDQIRADGGMINLGPDRFGAKSDDQYSPSWDEIAEFLLPPRKPKWLIGFRDIARNTDERTLISSVLPICGIGHTMPIVEIQNNPKFAAAFFGNLNAIVLDYCVRQKVGGTHLTYSYFKQFPVLPPTSYSEDDIDFIVERVLELTYTSWDLKDWAKDLGCFDPPFRFAPDRRAILRAELDARYARLYGLTRDELRFILDPADVMGPDYPTETFRVLKNREMSEFGEYRTGRLVVEAWDREERSCCRN